MDVTDAKIVLSSSWRENSNLKYTYDFFFYNENEFYVEEISYPLTEKRNLKIERNQHHFVKVIIEEENKKYIIGFNEASEFYDQEVLEDFGNMAEKAKNIEILNLENTLKIIKKPEKVSYCYIKKGKDIIASIHYKNNKFYEYEINKTDKKILVKSIYNAEGSVERIVERNGYEEYKETTSNNSIKIEEEYHKILKKI